MLNSLQSMFQNQNVQRAKQAKSNNIWFVCIVISLCILIEYLSSINLPEQRYTRSNPSSFSLANVRSNLVALTKFGPRVTGSYVNEIIIPHHLKDQLLKMKNSLPAGVQLDIDHQHSSSNFYLDFLGGITNVYKNVTNIIVRISWPKYFDENMFANKFDDFSILVNAHFDSIPGSPGAADDGIGIAVMLEVIRVIALGPSLQHSVIMLFNGAEESNHQAAHGFITQHPWAKNVKYVLNLESIGSGGQEMVFQCNSGRLAEFYSKTAPHPHVSVLAHELFKHLLHRMASTDWSTLLKYGPKGITGLDTAYVENGFVYHTSFDTADIVPNGTLVNTGENLLYMVRALASLSTSLNKKGEDNTLIATPHPITTTTSSVVYNDNDDDGDKGDEHAVFFDLLGLVVIAYHGVHVTIIHSFIAVLGGGVLLYVLAPLSSSSQSSILMKLGFILYREVYCYFAPIIVGLLFGYVVSLCCPMRWYKGGVTIAMVMYIPPTLLTALYTRSQIAAATASVTYNTASLRQVGGILFPWLILLIICIPLKIMSAYVSCLWIANTAFASGVYQVVRHYTLRHSLPPKKYIGSAEFWYILSMIPIITIWAQVSRITMAMVLPLLGKSGTVTLSDPVLGALIGMLVSAPASLLLAHEVSTGPVISKQQTIRYGILSMGTILIIGTCFLSPYAADRPKRLWIQHIARSITLPPSSSTAAAAVDANAVRTICDCGLWVSAFDSQGMAPLEKLGIDRLDGRYALSGSQCNSDNGEYYLNYPWYFPVAEVLRSSHYIPTACPDIGSSNSNSNTDRLVNNDRHVSMNRKGNNAVGQELNMQLSSYILPPSSSSSSSRSAIEVLRMIRISLTGPSKMHLIIRDNAHGRRLALWSILSDNENDSKDVHKLDSENNDIMSKLLSVSAESFSTSGEQDFVVTLARSTSDEKPEDSNQINNHLQYHHYHLHSAKRVTNLTKNISITVDGNDDRYNSNHDSTSTLSGNDYLRQQRKHAKVRFVSPPQTRYDGVHYLQIGFGRCSEYGVATTTTQSSQDGSTHADDGEGICQQTVYLVVRGTEPVELAAYGHYTAGESAKSVEIDALMKQLPDWTKGAEWTNFPSAILRNFI